MKYFSILFFLSLLSACSSPKAFFEIEKSSEHAPATVKLFNQSKNAGQFMWDFGDGNTSSEFQPIHRYSYSGKYIITLNAVKNKKKNTLCREVILDPPHHCLVEIKTSEGTLTIQLFDQTPLHRDNFIKLAESGYYNGTLFHRVIKGFMIQGGDPDSKNAPEGKRLGTGGPAYTIPAEFVDTLFHLKGMLAAARQGDAVNPQKASSGSQFYIVQGRPVTDGQLDAFELQKGIRYTPYARDMLKTMGGTPSLDKEYTVFGRVIKGLEIVDKIAENRTDNADRPLSDVKIISVNIIN